jgi:hypothetical protein
LRERLGKVCSRRIDKGFQTFSVRVSCRTVDSVQNQSMGLPLIKVDNRRKTGLFGVVSWLRGGYVWGCVWLLSDELGEVRQVDPTCVAHVFSTIAT